MCVCRGRKGCSTKPDLDEHLAVRRSESPWLITQFLVSHHPSEQRTRLEELWKPGAAELQMQTEIEMMESVKERSKQAVVFLFTEAPGRWFRGPVPRECRVPPRPRCAAQLVDFTGED